MANILKCSREGDKHSGPLRKTEPGLVCQECYAREQGITARKSQHGQTVCPNCGKVLMTRLRKGGISITSMDVRGSLATLKCECGYQKRIESPFGKPKGRDRALQEWRELERKRRPPNVLVEKK